MRRSRKPLSVIGGSRVQIPPPPLNNAGRRAEALRSTSHCGCYDRWLNPLKSTSVHGCPLVSCGGGERLANQTRGVRLPLKEQACLFKALNVGGSVWRPGRTPLSIHTREVPSSSIPGAPICAVSRYAIGSDGSLMLDDAVAGTAVDGHTGLRGSSSPGTAELCRIAAGHASLEWPWRFRQSQPSVCSEA
jgi:hypothetical protein